MVTIFSTNTSEVLFIAFGFSLKYYGAYVVSPDIAGF